MLAVARVPLFSVIIPTFNCQYKLQTTLSSLEAQNFCDYECIVVDAGSTDGTLSLLVNRDRKLHFISEPDKGIYDAMNKGISLAKGRFLYFLGAGDALRPEILPRIAKEIPRDENAFLYGNVFRHDTHSVYDGPFSSAKLCEKNICHQAIFYDRTIFKLVGAYKTQFAMLADWALNIQCFGNPKIHKVYVDEVIADYEGAGLSEGQPDLAFHKEFFRLVRQNFGFSQYAALRMRWIQNKFRWHFSKLKSNKSDC